MLELVLFLRVMDLELNLNTNAKTSRYLFQDRTLI